MKMKMRKIKKVENTRNYFGELPISAQSPPLGTLPFWQNASIGAPPQPRHGIPGSHMPVGPSDISLAYIISPPFSFLSQGGCDSPRSCEITNPPLNCSEQRAVDNLLEGYYYINLLVCHDWDKD